MIAAREFTTAAEIFANAKAVRAKFFGTASKPAPVIRRSHDPKPATAMRNSRRPCEWEKGNVYFDQHVTAYRIAKRIQSFRDFVPDGKYHTAHSVVMEVLADFPRYTLADLKGERGQLEKSTIRGLAIYAVRRQCPHMSFEAIGNYFGGREQTTIVAAVKRMERFMKVGGRDPRKRMTAADEARAFELWKQGVRVPLIADEVGVSRAAIYDLSYRLNWPARGTNK